MALCPSPEYTADCDGSWDRAVSARAQWAYTHGLAPLDGAYLRELIHRPLTLSQLGEALAILSQTSQMVAETIEQLGGLGLIEPTPDDAPDPYAPSQDAIAVELAAAVDDLQLMPVTHPADADVPSARPIFR